MRIRTAIRKTVKWGGAALVVVLLVVWIESVGWGATSPDFGPYYVELMPGALFLRIDSPDPERRQWTFYEGGARGPFNWWFRYVDYDTSSVLVAPLWLPLLLTLIPTGFAWRPDIIARLRSRRGACMKCGYARTGLAPAAVCPECGTAPVAAGAAAKA